MSATVRLIVGGLPPDIPLDELRQLVAPAELGAVQPEGPHHAPVALLAVLRLGGDARQTERLRQRLERRPVAGHRLWTWLSVRPWA